MSTLERFGIGALLLCGLVALAPRAAAQSDDESRVGYATVARTGAELRNVPNANGLPIAELAEGSIVRVHGERAGWAKVEPPGGFAVWIYRKFVETTSDPKVVEVTRNGVNVRALPSSEVNNYPVGQLYAGDRVRVLPTPPALAKEAADWIHISSPPGFWGWLRTGHLAPVSDDADGERLWKEAKRALVLPAGAPVTSDRPKSEAAAQPEPPAEGVKLTQEALDRANQALERERGRDKPNFDLVRAAYASVLELDSSTEVKLLVDTRLETINALEAMADLRAELETEKERRAREQEELLRTIRDDVARKDPLGGQFDERGLLERRVIAEEARYYLRWGGRDVCELVCTTGRYDLDLFLGLDVGVRGELLPLAAETGGQTATPIVDLARIEILARG